MRYIFIQFSLKWIICSVFLLILSGCGGGGDRLLEGGLKALEKGDAAKASILLEEAAEKMPADATTFLNLGIAYWQDDQPEAAIGALRRAAELTSAEPEPYEFMGKVYTDMESWDEALLSYEHAMDRGGRTARLLTAAAVVKLHTDDLIEARILLTEALKTEPLYSPALYNLAILYKDRNRREAAKYYRRFIEAASDPSRTGPPVSDSYLTEAESYIKEETRDPAPPPAMPRQADAEEVKSEEVEPVEPSKPVRAAPIANAQDKQDKPAGPDAESLLKEAQAAVNSSEFVLAKKKLEQARELAPTDAEPLWQLAVLYDKHLEFASKAEVLYREFKSNFPDDSRSRLIILPEDKQVTEDRGQRTEPIDTIEPGKAQELFDMAFEAHRAEDWDRAISLYKQALEHDGSLYNATYNMGLIYKKQGKMRMAKDLFVRTTQLDPNHVKAWYMQALAGKELMEHSAAVSAAETALKVQPDYVRAHYLLGILHAMQNRSGQAKKYFNSCIKLAPGDPMADKAREHINNLP